MPPHCSVDLSVSPDNTGTTAGAGVYTNQTTATIIAAPNPGFAFANWSENGAVVSVSASYTFTNSLNQSLVANFVASPSPLMQLQSVTAHDFLLAWPTNYSGFRLQENTAPDTTNWVNSTHAVGASGSQYQVTIPATNAARFFRLWHP